MKKLFLNVNIPFSSFKIHGNVTFEHPLNILKQVVTFKKC